LGVRFYREAAVVLLIWRQKRCLRHSNAKKK
jgi:hypothetical protein